jgi:hypothetical protein
MQRKSATTILLAACALLVGVSGLQPAEAKRDDQGQARMDMRTGAVRSLREIEGSILPQMRGSKYLGPEYDPAAMAYRLKFIREGRVVWLDVDARTGRVLRRSN